MSCIFLITPIIASWPLFTTAAAAVAGALGYRVLQADQTANVQVEKEVEIQAENFELLKEMLESKGSFSLTKDNVIIKFDRNLRGQCRICACESGSQYTDQELKEIGTELYSKIMQEYSYRKVKDDLAAKGYNVLEEQVDETGTIQIQVRKWS